MTRWFDGKKQRPTSAVLSGGDKAGLYISRYCKIVLFLGRGRLLNGQ